MSYEVLTDVFEGPFHLLLELITAQQVEIYDVSLSDIVDAYLVELDRMASLDLEATTEFVLIAATLIELKCRRLLPEPEGIELDEELALFEARDYLLARLVECRTFARAGQALERLLERAGRSVARSAGPDDRFDHVAPDLLTGLTPERLRAALVAALLAVPPPRVALEHVLVDELTVAEVLSSLVPRLEMLRTASFRELTLGLGSRPAVIAHFLAVLELYKRGLVDLDQATSFGELRVSWCPNAAVMGEHLTEHLAYQG